MIIMIMIIIIIIISKSFDGKTAAAQIHITHADN